MRTLGRVLVPLVTPFHEDGSVNYDRAGELARYVVDNNYCDTIIVGGTTGEFAQLATEERIRLIQTVWDAVGKDCPVIAGTGSSNTFEAIRITQEAERIGVDMAMVVAPYYTKATQEGIYEHYKAVAGSTSLPIMLYNIPLFTGVNIEPDTFTRLIQIKNIAAIKEEAGINPVQMSAFILNARASGENVMFYDGDDTMILPILIQGGIGVVSGGAQIIGDRIKQMIDAFYANRLSEATELHLKVFPLFQAFGQRVNPIPMVKEALNMVGFKVGKPRLPLMPGTEAEKAVLRQALTRLEKL